MCPVWRAALELVVSEHCSFPEIPSGYLEVPKEEDSGWALQVAVQALHHLTLPGMSMEERNRTTRTWQ